LSSGWRGRKRMQRKGERERDVKMMEEEVRMRLFWMKLKSMRKLCM
jgi:hypothetical protein